MSGTGSTLGGRGGRRVRAALAGFAALAALAACGGGKAAPSPAAAPTPEPARVVRASAGDTVYVIEHTVRADRRQQFERFLNDSYWPAVRLLARTDSTTAKVLRQTRVLYPVRPNDDGTLTYVFLTDPVVRGETYNILETLRRVYSPAETDRRYRELTDSWAARTFAARPFVQAAYPTEGPVAAANAAGAPGAATPAGGGAAPAGRPGRPQ